MGLARLVGWMARRSLPTSASVMYAEGGIFIALIVAFELSDGSSISISISLVLLLCVLAAMHLAKFGLVCLGVSGAALWPLELPSELQVQGAGQQNLWTGALWCGGRCRPPEAGVGPLDLAESGLAVALVEDGVSVLVAFDVAAAL